MSIDVVAAFLAVAALAYVSPGPDWSVVGIDRRLAT